MMYSVFTAIMFITYCLLVHSVIKVPTIGESNHKLTISIFTLLLCEMLIMTMV